MLGLIEKSLSLRREVYAHRLKSSGEEHVDTIREAICFCYALRDSRDFINAKELMCKTLPVARRVLGNTHEYTLRTEELYALALYKADGATLDDLHEAVTTLEETERTARRVMGGAHPITTGIEVSLRNARRALVRKHL